MVKNEIIALLASCFALLGCSADLEWRSFAMDGSRTGVSAPTALNAAQALGVIEGGVYISPNGQSFDSASATYAVAVEMIAAQERMAAVKEVIAQSSMEVERGGINNALSYWTADFIASAVADITGRKVDLALMNSGGIRVDMPKGDVILDDILSMFPFKNYLCYVSLKGSDLRALLEQLASTKLQPLSGVKMVVEGGKMSSLLVGGQPLDDDRVYGLATIDFLLDGGDGINAAKNAKELIITKELIVDRMLPYVRSYAARGEALSFSVDDRIVVK